ncbi:hypothetical protein GQR60_00690 [Labilibaculum sp. A4]|uniref:hypothetical protein n=1 Tax=Labilibaculum euxinus TaxID=2686357 RepID=UPI000F622B17|nr:hypothetical protein [Labilibaculum euxinus]MDQ1769333.1 hypothetical protein [Labilibaculum euxinus]MWN74858.1 hypothetical protein [Labilibaculum euxinus]
MDLNKITIVNTGIRFLLVAFWADKFLPVKRKVAHASLSSGMEAKANSISLTNFLNRKGFCSSSSFDIRRDQVKCN